MTKQIVAMGGGGFLMEPDNPLLDDFVLSLARGAQSRVCLLPTPAGDSNRMIAQFYTWLGPRCKATHLPLFKRRHDDLDAVLARARRHLRRRRQHGQHARHLARARRRRGAAPRLRSGRGARRRLGAARICWFAHSVTDSFGPLARLDDGLAFLDGSMCPHYDGEAQRRPTYHALVSDGLPAGYAADDGCAIHFVDGALRETVSSRPDARAYRVKRAPDGAVVETPLPTRFLGAR